MLAGATRNHGLQKRMLLWRGRFGDRRRLLPPGADVLLRKVDVCASLHAAWISLLLSLTTRSFARSQTRRAESGIPNIPLIQICRLPGRRVALPQLRRRLQGILHLCRMPRGVLAMETTDIKK